MCSPASQLLFQAKACNILFLFRFSPFLLWPRHARAAAVQATWCTMTFSRCTCCRCLVLSSSSWMSQVFYLLWITLFWVRVSTVSPSFPYIWLYLMSTQLKVLTKIALYKMASLAYHSLAYVGSYFLPSKYCNITYSFNIFIWYHQKSFSIKPNCCPE